MAGTWYDATEVSVVGAECVIERNGTNISANPNFGTADADDTNGNNFEQALVITEIDSNRPAGTNTYNLACAEDAADFSINSLTTTVVALGS